MIHAKKHFLHAVEVGLHNILAHFQSPSQRLLALWFAALLKTMHEAQLRGSISQTAWIPTRDSLQPIDWPQKSTEQGEHLEPLYLTSAVQLPVVTRRGKTYQPTISQTTFAHGIFPQTVPEVEATILDLSLQTVKGEGESITLKFTKRYDHQTHKKNYELRTSKVRELSLTQCTFIKLIFDKAVIKMRKPIH